MKPDLYTKAVLTVIALMLTAIACDQYINPTATANAQSRTSPAMKWEYNVMADLFTDVGGRYETLNQKGNEGWELVAVAMTKDVPYCYFKRPKP
jgi:hypothetical protein